MTKEELAIRIVKEAAEAFESAGITHVIIAATEDTEGNVLATGSSSGSRRLLKGSIREALKNDHEFLNAIIEASEELSN